MTEQEAKKVIQKFLNGSSNVAEYLEALNIAVDVLGKDCTIPDIDRWVNESKSGQAV